MMMRIAKDRSEPVAGREELLMLAPRGFGDRKRGSSEGQVEVDMRCSSDPTESDPNHHFQLRARSSPSCPLHQGARLQARLLRRRGSVSQTQAPSSTTMMTKRRAARLHPGGATLTMTMRMTTRKRRKKRRMTRMERMLALANHRHADVRSAAQATASSMSKQR